MDDRLLSGHAPLDEVLGVGRILAGCGWSLSEPDVEVMHRSPVDVYIDEWVYDLLGTVQRIGARRVVLDDAVPAVPRPAQPGARDPAALAVAGCLRYLVTSGRPLLSAGPLPCRCPRQRP